MVNARDSARTAARTREVFEKKKTLAFTVEIIVSLRLLYTVNGFYVRSIWPVGKNLNELYVRPCE